MPTKMSWAEAFFFLFTLDFAGFLYTGGTLFIIFRDFAGFFLYERGLVCRFWLALLVSVQLTKPGQVFSLVKQ